MINGMIDEYTQQGFVEHQEQIEELSDKVERLEKALEMVHDYVIELLVDDAKEHNEYDESIRADKRIELWEILGKNKSKNAY